MDTQTGFIGFFDILGYKEILENNEPEEIAEKIIPFFENLKNETIGFGKKAMAMTMDRISVARPQSEIVRSIVEEEMNAAYRSISWLIFSDTILLSMPIDIDNSKIMTEIMAFLCVCDSMQIQMFNEGLPLRGAIDYGKYYIKGSCFAGQPIVNAYNLSNKLELAACALSPNANEKIKNGFNLPVRLFDDYLTPTKEGEENIPLLRALNYSFQTPGSNDDIRQLVLNSFWDYNKSISLSVQNKITNTEQWLRYRNKR